MKTVKKSTFWVLAVMYLSYFVVAFPDGAFTIAWLGMEAEFSLTVAHTGYMVVAGLGMYSLASALLERLSRLIKLGNIDLLGTVVLGLGFVGLGLSPNFIAVLISIAVYGLGMGMIASSVSSYMAKHFTARHMNLLYCVWGLGATLSPFIVAQMIIRFDWRAGYFALAGIAFGVSVIVLISMVRKAWDREETVQAEEAAPDSGPKKYLGRRWHQVMEVLTCFVLGGMDYSLVFFAGIVMTARGLDLETVALFPMAYYIAITAGRLVFAWLAKWLKDITAIRIGLVLGLAGIVILDAASSLAGIALAGFGIAPILPCILHDTSNRFESRVLNKMVGYEVAAYSAGIAVLFFAISQVLEFISLEILFPIGIGLLAVTFLLNEILEFALRISRS